MQVALRNKEDLLVQTALDRIHRAQMLGKANVTLTQPEIDALERKRRQDKMKSKSSDSSRRNSGSRRTSGQLKVSLKEQKSTRRKSSGPVDGRSRDSSSASSKHAPPPGMIVPVPGGVPYYAPFEQYPPGTQGRSPRAGSRSGNTQSLHQRNPNSPTDQARMQQVRYLPDPEGSSSPSPQSPSIPRRLPDDPSWLPRPRSASSNQSYPGPYQPYPPPSPQIPPHYGPGRRHISGPPDVQYLGTRRMGGSSRSHEAYASQSPLREIPPYHPSNEHPSSESASDEDLSGSDHGVQINVVPRGETYEIEKGPEETSSRRRRTQR